VSNEDELRGAAPRYYENLFNSDTYWTNFPPLIVKRKLTHEVANGSSDLCLFLK